LCLWDKNYYYLIIIFKIFNNNAIYSETQKYLVRKKQEGRDYREAAAVRIAK